LLMCTFPRKDWDYEKAKGGAGKGAWAAMYFNECMNGFEYQVAGHMIWEGMVQEGLAITRAVHDRYHAAKRNPWNEVECGDHYARSMASYGVFLAACGFEYNGPKGQIGFAPRLTPENFRVPFTVAEGWGSYSQQTEGRGLRSVIAVKWGRLKVRTVVLALAKTPVAGVTVTHAGRGVAATHRLEEGRLTVTLSETVEVTQGQKLEILTT
jgi:non-lysosomal glucosylceramidase